MREDRLSRFQQGALLWCAMVSPMIRQAPGAAAAAAGRGAWVSAVFALPLGAVLGLALGRFFPRRGTLSFRGAARLLPGLWALWTMFYAGFVLRAGADRFVSAVYPESEPWIFMAVMLALAVRAGLGSLRTLGRCAAVTAPVLGAMFLLVFLACVPNMESANLLPLTRSDAAGAAKGLWPLGCAMAVGVPLGALTAVRGRGGSARPFTLAFLGQGLLALALCVTTVGTFGPAMTARMNYPFFVMIRSIRLPHLLERVEALVAALWVAADFLLLALLLHAAAFSAALALRGCGGEKRPVGVWCCAGLAALCGVFCAPTSIALRTLGDVWIPRGHALWSFAILPGALAVRALRKKEK